MHPLHFFAIAINGQVLRYENSIILQIILLNNVLSIVWVEITEVVQ